MRRPIVEEEIEIARMIEEKYMKVFEKKKSERMSTRKTWDHAIDLKEGFVLKK